MNENLISRSVSNTARLITVFLGLCFGAASCPGYLLSAPIDSDELAQVSRQLTAEEKTNINVYEASNRSVININTKATVTTGFFLMKVHQKALALAS